MTDMEPTAEASAQKSIVEPSNLEQRLKIWIRYYNSERLHAALGYKTPEEWRKEHQSAACPLPGDFFAIFSLRQGSLHYAPGSRYARHAHASVSKSQKTVIQPQIQASAQKFLKLHYRWSENGVIKTGIKHEKNYFIGCFYNRFSHTFL